ncbi:sigma-70 family RNA polymerase sigma factor [Paenibacillus vini]|uniref:RNA polymerase sigma factor SigJ n=1 Tax=Paenibacillus vini TaxID=1476024 RepID=A0ABQ4M807_9BACL|nr:sigma-70 family RNA polymerase sigma factor [Paenibacillus vini]GIP52128.1 RNA polymerase sigma factor SigJ [Paenibacillus vini]
MTTDLEQYYHENKSNLTALSYRLTGSWVEAEDIVQETFLAMFENAAGLEHIRAPGPYFRRAVVNRSLNAIQSPRLSRETYFGTWLPEPVFLQTSHAADEPILREEQISYAFMTMLEHLSPQERAVFVLRESFGIEYDEIASILGKNEAACRKLLSRARKKLGPVPPESPPSDQIVPGWVSAFLKAARTGEFAPLLEMFNEDAVMWSDGGGKVRSAIHPITSRKRIIAFWAGITKKGSMEGDLVPTLINGQEGLVLYRNGVAVKVILIEGDHTGHIVNIYLITNPDKLIHVPAKK